MTSSTAAKALQMSVTIAAVSFFRPTLCIAVASSAAACLLLGWIFSTSFAESMAFSKEFCPSKRTVRCRRHLARMTTAPSSAAHERARVHK